MFEAIKRFFSAGVKIDYSKLVRQGAVIVDVRTANEFKSGHIRGSINIPVDQLTNDPGALKDKDKPIITCCASGMRSATAKILLKSKGYSAVFNAGSWTSLQRKL